MLKKKNVLVYVLRMANDRFVEFNTTTMLYMLFFANNVGTFNIINFFFHYRLIFLCIVTG